MRILARAAVTVASCAIATVGATVAVSATASSAAPRRLDGYTAASSATQRAIEKQFLAIPSRSVAQSLDKDLANRTGLVGSPNGKRRMEKIVAYLKSYGLQPRVHKYYVYKSTPKKVSVQMTSPMRYTAPNKEKCRAVERWCDSHLWEGRWVLERAYADHHTDAPLLEAAQEARAVCPGKTLAISARRRGWPMLDWDD